MSGTGNRAHGVNRTTFGRVHIRAQPAGSRAVNVGFHQRVHTTRCTASCCRVLLAVLLVLAGFIVTMVGLFAKPFWGPEDDWCSFCREERLTTERNLANCRIAGPIILVLGLILLLVSLRLNRRQRANNQNQNSSEMRTAGQADQPPPPQAAETGASNQMTGAFMHQPPPSHYTGSQMPGYTHPQPPYPTVMPTAPYPPGVGEEFAYPPSAAQFSVPTAVGSEPPPPSYEAAVGVQTAPTSVSEPYMKG